MAWSGFGQMHLVWKEASVQELSGPVAGRMQPAHYQFPTFRRSSVLPQTSQIKLCKTSPGPISFWLIVPGFGQTVPVPKQASVQESSIPLLANSSWMQHVYWVTWIVLCRCQCGGSRTSRWRAAAVRWATCRRGWHWPRPATCPVNPSPTPSTSSTSVTPPLNASNWSSNRLVVKT